MVFFALDFSKEYLYPGGLGKINMLRLSRLAKVKAISIVVFILFMCREGKYHKIRLDSFRGLHVGSYRQKICPQRNQ